MLKQRTVFQGGLPMYCQFENRYIMTEDMIREYLCQIVCKRLINVCIALFAIFALACGGTWYLGIYYAAEIGRASCRERV